MTEQPIGQGIELGTDQGDQQATDSTVPSVNPAWSELLGVVPEQLHSQVTPHLSKWDQNFQSKINEVHSQYEPWKPIIDQGATPDDVNYALGLLNALSENPQEVIKALTEWAGAESSTEQQGQFNQTQQQVDPNDDPILSHPKFQEMQKNMEAMAQIILSQREQEQQAQADQELETDLSTLREKYKDRGDFDEEYVLTLAANSDKFDFNALEKAVEKFYEKRDGILSSKRPPGPPVLGSGGAIPASAPDIKNATDSERRQIIAGMLAQAQQNT
jgi:hypothetical protein